MRVLGIDTATWRASVGVVVDAEIVQEYKQETTGNHAVAVLDLIDRSLKAAGISAASLDAIAVSAGPGSFTGLRVGLSAAKGLARATGTPLVAIPTLEALASTVEDRFGVICPILDARKSEVYAAAFESKPSGGLRRLMDDSLLPLDRIDEHLPQGCIVVGDAEIRYAQVLRERLAATVLPFELHGTRGGTVALLGEKQALSGKHCDLASLEPFYIRPSEAETKLA